MSRTSPVSPSPSPVAATLASNRLGTVRLAQFALGAAAPLTVVAGVIPTGFGTTGIIGIPAAFLAMTPVLVVFCVGYTAMSRRIRNAGAFYAYIARGLGRPFGVAAAWQAVLAYNALQVGLYGIFGATAAPLLNPVLGVAVPWWGYAVVAWAVVALLGWLRVDVSGSVLAVLMAAEVVVIVIFNAADLLHPAAGHISVTTLAPSHLLVPGVGALLVTAITGFTGFESAAFYAEEAKDSRRTVPAATYLTVIGIGLLYSVSAWAESVATGPDHVAADAARDQGETVFVLAAGTLGPVWATVGHTLLITSVLAAMISYHSAVGRYLFALGREGVLPRMFGRTVLRTGAPLWGSVSQTVIGLVVIVLYAVNGWDPMVQLFFWGGTAGGFGVLVLLMCTSGAVIGYFVRNPGENVWRAIIAPGLALVLLLIAVTAAVANFATLLGVDATSPLRWIFPATFLVAAAVGVVWALLLRATAPTVYGQIGMGVDARTSLLDPSSTEAAL